MARQPHKQRRNDGDELRHEAWAIPYGDLVTLLLAFFVVMYSVSSLNEGRYRVMSESLSAAFRGKPSTSEPVQISRPTANGGPDLAMNLMVTQQPPVAADMFWRVPFSAAVPTDEAGEGAVAEAAAQRMQSIATEIEEALGDLIRAGEVNVRRSEFFIEVEIRTDVLFPSGVARLSDGVVPTLERLGRVLAPFSNLLRVEGHTDSVPISTLQFPSNWELSAARAASVVRTFAEQGVAPERMALVGFGEHYPVGDNDTIEGRNRNRRVMLMVLDEPGGQLGTHGFTGPDPIELDADELPPRAD